MILEKFLEIFPRSTPQQHEKLEQFCAMFLEKNSHINLSAFRDAETVWEKHFIDSLLGADLVRKHNPHKLLDMGSGGGFPAIPLAVCFPEIQIFPFDSVQKKMRAVQEFAENLQLFNVQTVSGRAEELGRMPKFREKMEMVTARAFAHFSPLLEMTLPFLKMNGILLAYRGPENGEEDEIFVDYFGGFLHEKHVFTLPSGEKREIWEIEKVEPTEKMFPRAVGMPKKFPMTLEDFETL